MTLTDIITQETRANHITQYGQGNGDIHAHDQFTNQVDMLFQIKTGTIFLSRYGPKAAHHRMTIHAQTGT